MTIITRSSRKGTAISETEPENFDHALQLIFAAFKALTGEADRLLTRQGLGRAHFRALFNIVLQPGLSVSELSRILGVSLQAINRVLNDLRDRELIHLEASATDGRKRKLYVTQEGRLVHDTIYAAQSDVLKRAIALSPPETFESYMTFLANMVSGADTAPPKRSSSTKS